MRTSTIFCSSVVLPRTVLAAVAACLLGCGTTTTSRSVAKNPEANSNALDESRLRYGDKLQIRLDLRTQSPEAIVVEVDGDGQISLPLIGRIQAAGLTASELAERIEANYVPRYYVRCTATIIASERFFYVGGEVRGPGKVAWNEDVTILKAINIVGGFTDYADRKRVQIVREGKNLFVDCEDLLANPKKDISILPGDSITIKRGLF